MTTVNSVTTGPILTYFLSKMLIKGAHAAKNFFAEEREIAKNRQAEKEAAVARGELVKVGFSYEEFDMILGCGMPNYYIIYVKPEEIVEEHEGRVVLTNGTVAWKCNDDTPKAAEQEAKNNATKYMGFEPKNDSTPRRVGLEY